MSLVRFAARKLVFAASLAAEKPSRWAAGKLGQYAVPVLLGGLFALSGGYPLGAANAQTMFQPADVTTNMGQAPADVGIRNVIDGSGLSTPYTSGVTDLAFYNAPHAITSPLPNGSFKSTFWYSSLTRTTGLVTFDMGNGFNASLSQLAFWNAERSNSQLLTL